MKAAARRPIWALSATKTARGAELLCWLIAGAIIVMLAAGAPSGGASARPSGAFGTIDSTAASAVVGVAPAAALQYPSAPIFPWHCVKHVIERTKGRSESFKIDQMNKQCFTRHRHNAVTRTQPPLATCRLPFTGAPQPAVNVSGCLRPA